MAGSRLQSHEGHLPLNLNVNQYNRQRDESKHTEDEDDAKKVSTVERECG